MSWRSSLLLNERNRNVAMIFVLLLCGPPGVGKSTVALKVSQLIEQRNFSGGRTSILSTILEFDKIETDRDLWDESSFRKSRESGIEQLQEMIGIAAHNAPTSDTVIIVDDIMYLHSMRRAIYVMCRDLNVHHLMIVRVVADMELAMSRNSLRPDSRRMSDETMRKIFSRFEEPDNSLVHERHSFVLDNTCCESSDIELAALIDTIEAKLSEESSVPIPSRAILGDREHSERSSTSKGVLDAVSEVDLVMRKLVSSILRDVNSLQDIKKLPSIRSEISKLACEVKASVLERVRSNKNRIGRYSSPSSLTQNNGERSHSESIVNDSTAGAFGGDSLGEGEVGEGARVLSVKMSSDSDNDVLPSEQTTSFYVNFFHQTLHKKIENYFDSSVYPSDNSITMTSPIPNTSIRDSILHLLQQNCNTFLV